jgi:hypothetical protein
MSEIVVRSENDLVIAECGPEEELEARCSSHSALTRRDERGMVSAEWAVGIIAAIAIAGVLLGVVTNGATKTALLNFILHVISLFSAQG